MTTQAFLGVDWRRFPGWLPQTGELAWLARKGGGTPCRVLCEMGNGYTECWRVALPPGQGDSGISRSIFVQRCDLFPVKPEVFDELPV